ncbi:P-loop containing nucleoside triphosphate hydrolase [Phytophthora cactorum]|nr:P-loop containing nucleoside triphosphate hydrolase [Phytophthora cactorum]
MWTCRRLSSHLSATARGFRSSCVPWASTGSHLSDVSFASLPINQRSKDVLTRDMGYEFLTHVQNDTLPLVLAGRDVLAKGKTGNGKTMAFLLPALERMLTHPQPKQGKVGTADRSGSGEAHGRPWTAHVLLRGGSSVNKDVKELTQSGGIDAHLEDNSGRIRQKLDSLQVLVLDEADRLLDMGFRPDIMGSSVICRKSDRLCSSDLKDVALRDDYAFVDTIEGDDQQTNTQTVQEYVCATCKTLFPSWKAFIVFLPTARSAQFMAQLFQAAGFPNVLEMHSRKSQSARTKAADAFRKGKKMIMFSSDVSARGVDYPDVSLVLQVGLTDRDQYIHRLGRTARAGMEGRGILVLADFEKSMLQLEQRPQLDQQNYRTTRALANVRQRSELEQSAEKAYAAFLGFYNSNLKKLGMSKTKLVETGALYSQLIGLEKVPLLQKKTLRAMGLMGTPGLTVASKPVRAGGPKSRGPKSRGPGELERFTSDNYQSIHGRKKKGDRSNQKQGGSLWKTFGDNEAKSPRSEQSFKSDRSSRSASMETKREGRSLGNKRSVSPAAKRNYKEPHNRY